MMKERSNSSSSKRKSFLKLILGCVATIAIYDAIGSANNVSKMSFRYLATTDDEAQDVEQQQPYESTEMTFVMPETQFDSAMFHSQSGPPPMERTGPGDNTVFLLGIFSTMKDAQEVDARQRIRDTYLSYNNDPRICSLKDYMSIKNMERIDPSDKKDDTTKSSKDTDDETRKTSAMCKVLYTFVIGGNEDAQEGHYRVEPNIPLTVSQLPSQEEQSEDDDCTYLNIKENISSQKTLTWFKYASQIAQQYDIDYVSKLDSDTMVSMAHLLDYIVTDLPPIPYAVRVYGGSLNYHNPNTPSGNINADGQFVFLSTDLADFCSSDEIDREEIITNGYTKKASTTPETHREDLDLGSIVWSHPYPIKAVFMNQRILWIHQLKSSEEWMGLWEETNGVLPLTRVIGQIEMEVKPGDFSAYLESKGVSVA